MTAILEHHAPRHGQKFACDTMGFPGPMPPSQRVSKGPPQARAEAPGIWDGRVAPWLERWAAVLAVALAALACARIVATYEELSITSDEPAHLAYGLEYWSGRFYPTEHPPLSRTLMALEPYLEGLRVVKETDMSADGYAALAQSAHFDRTVFWMRLGILPFFVLACWVTYLWTARQFGRAAAALAIAWFTLEPTVLAHAGLATTDMALTAGVGGAFLSLLLWAETPSWKHAALLGAAWAMAVLSKFTALAYLPASAVFALAIWIALRRPAIARLAALVRERVPTFCGALAVFALLVWAVYRFSFGSAAPGNLHLPAPAFFTGIADAFGHAKAHPNRSFLLGQVSTGFWYFFPVVLAVKTPIALLAAAAVGAAVCWRRRAQGGLLPLALALGVLLPAMASRVNIGARHILPVYLVICLLGALGLIQMARWFRSPAMSLGLPAALLLWMAISGARQHPDYLAYFNAFAGDQPDTVLVDSDLDWGQGIRLLSRRLREAHATRLSALFLQDTKYLPLLARFYQLPPTEPLRERFPAPGWNVLSPTVLRYSPGGARLQEHRAAIDLEGRRLSSNGPWFDWLPPAERAGGLLLYNIPPGFEAQ